MKRASIFFALVFVAATAQAIDTTELLLAKAWPPNADADLEQIGAGIGIVFTPDLSVPGNCRFYTALGFACFESADWRRVLTQIQSHNASGTDVPIRTLVLETHGTNGHGLKLQAGPKPDDARSYIAVAALQEMLDPVGVRYVIISACNSGRLLRPDIYRRLNRTPGDKLFLPPTRGIIDATPSFDPRRTRVTVITPEKSHIETTLVGAIRELAPSTRTAIQRAAKKRNVVLPKQFAISEMLIQMLLRDEGLRLRTGAHVEELSKEQTSPEASERIFSSFVTHLDYVAARERGPASKVSVGGR